MRYAFLILILALSIRPSGAFDFSQTPVISTDGHQLLVNNEPIRGMFVMWHAGKVDEKYTEDFYRAEFRKMKALGIIGVGFEIGWSTVEPKEGEWDFDSYGLDKVITWAAEEGLWVHLLLTPHYTPGWVFQKYGDVKMKTAEGKDAKGSFLAFSPSSPVVDDQVRFQQAAVRHYEKFNNILAFFLTNEQGYGNDWVDHSTWARESWVKWLGRDADIPKSENDKLWNDWLLFRRQEFNRYFNRLYDGASAARSRFIPIGHKFVFYGAFDAFASKWGLHISPLQTRMDIVGCDAYGGSSYIMYAGQLAQGKPILLTETNFRSTPDDEGGRGKMARMLLDQYFHGVQVQTVYVWNNFDKAKAPLGMNYPDGKPLTGTLGVGAVAGILAGIHGNTGLIPTEVGIIVPTRVFSQHSGWYWIFQHPMSDVLSGFDKYGLRSRVIYSDDLLPSAYPGRSGKPISLDGCKIILGVTDFGEDRPAYESQALREWVRGGGVLFLESLRYGAPAWTGITETEIASESAYSSTGKTKFWRVSGQKAQGKVAGKLAANASGAKILARWDRDNSPAVLAVPCGKGWVVYAGTLIFGDMGEVETQNLLWDVLEIAGYEPPVAPTGPTYLVMGDALFLKADSDWKGKARIPDGFTVEAISQYDADAEEMQPTITLEDGRLKGKLAKDEFCIVRLKCTAP